MAKKHIQASGEKEGQLVDCPANHQCTLKGPDGEPQQHFEISRDRESVERELNVAKDRASFYSELADDAEKDDDSEAGHLRESSDEENATVQALEAELAEHDKAEKAQKKYSEYMAKKYSAGTNVGEGKKKQKRKKSAKKEEPATTENNDYVVADDGTPPWPSDDDEDFRDGKSWGKWRGQVSRWGAKTRAYAAVHNADTDQATLEALSYHQSRQIQEDVAEHPNTHPETLRRILEEEPDGSVSLGDERHKEEYRKIRSHNRLKYAAITNPNTPAEYVSIDNVKNTYGSLSDQTAVYHVAERAEDVSPENYKEAVEAAKRVNGSWRYHSAPKVSNTVYGIENDRPTARLLDAVDVQAKRGGFSDHETAQIKRDLTIADPVGASHSSHADEGVLNTVVDRARTIDYEVSFEEAQKEGLPGSRDKIAWRDRIRSNEERAISELRRSQSETARKQITEIAQSEKAPVSVLSRLADNNDKAAMHALQNPSTPKESVAAVADKDQSTVNPDVHVAEARLQMETRYGDKGPWGEIKKREARAREVNRTGEGNAQERAHWGKRDVRLAATRELARSDNGTQTRSLTQHPDTDVRLTLASESTHHDTLLMMFDDTDDNVRNTARRRFNKEEHERWRADQELRRRQREYGTPDGRPKRPNQYVGD